MELSLGEIGTGFLGAILTAIVGYFTVVKKAKSDEASIALNAWKELLLPLQEELKEAKQEISALREALEIAEERHKNERAELVKEIQQLRSQVKKYQTDKNKK